MPGAFHHRCKDRRDGVEGSNFGQAVELFSQLALRFRIGTALIPTQEEGLIFRRSRLETGGLCKAYSFRRLRPARGALPASAMALR